MRIKVLFTIFFLLSVFRFFWTGAPVAAQDAGFMPYIGGTDTDEESGDGSSNTEDSSNEEGQSEDSDSEEQEEVEKKNEEYEEKIEELEEKIEEYEEKIEDLHDEAASLSKEISLTDNQISLTGLRIQNSETAIKQKESAIADLSADINNLGERIAKLRDSIAFQADVLNKRLRARYKVFDTSAVVILFGAKDLSTAIQKSEYLKIMGRYDKKLLAQMQETKNAFSLQKELFEEKKSEEETLKVQIEEEKKNLVSYKAVLAEQKEYKEELLEETEHDEQNYQRLLAQVQSELAALQYALNLPDGEGEEVKEGEIIGFMGNTGCSSGPHLHFGFVRDGSARDPLPFLESGKLKWPVENYSITQYFGENYNFYMNNFGIPGHDAIDIINTKVWSGSPIRAARDGEIYYKTDDKVYCPWLNNSLGKGAVIDHGDGERTIYWHLQ